MLNQHAHILSPDSGTMSPESLEDPEEDAVLPGKLIIEGVTTEGRKFRPSDWAERMSGALSTFDRGRRIHYSPMLQPMARKGVKCVVIDLALKEANPELYSYIMNFARSNRLKVIGEE